MTITKKPGVAYKNTDFTQKLIIALISTGVAFIGTVVIASLSLFGKINSVDTNIHNELKAISNVIYVVKSDLKVLSVELNYAYKNVVRVESELKNYKTFSSKQRERIKNKSHGWNGR